MITYNQESYIKQAIESALMQNTSFNYELVIGEDCSTDLTRLVIEQYQSEFPDKIRLLLNEQNIGAVKNIAATMKACQGKYIAILEGDDYWTSSDKLQKQVDFLERNPKYSSCYHAAQLVDRFGDPKIVIPTKKFRTPTSSLIDLIVHDSFMATCSVMFRNQFSGAMPPVFFASNMIADWPLNMLNAQTGLIGYIDEVMAVYRSNSSDGAFTAKRSSDIMHEAIKINEAFDEYLDFRYHDIFLKKLARYYFIMSMDFISLGEFKKAIWAMRKSVQKNFKVSFLLQALFVKGPSNYIKRILRNMLGGRYSQIRKKLFY